MNVNISIRKYIILKDSMAQHEHADALLSSYFYKQVHHIQNKFKQIYTRIKSMHISTEIHTLKQVHNSKQVQIRK